MLADFQTIHPRQLQHDSNITVGVTFPFLNNKCELFDKGNNPLFFDNIARTKRTIENFVFDTYIRTGSFWDIINNQVHIFPSLIQDYGLVLSQKETEYYIWNSYTTKSVFIEEPVVTGDIGVTLQFDLAGNFTLQPGQGTPGSMTVFVEGPVTAKTEFEIKYTVQGDAQREFNLVATCTRIIIFPFFPDWRESVKFRMRFETVNVSLATLKEQRRPLMAKPQRIISFTNTDYIRNLIENSLDFAEDKNIGIPLPHEFFSLVSVDGDGMGVVMNGDTSLFWNLKRYCNYIGFLDLETNSIFAKRIISVLGSHLEFDTPLLDVVSNLSKVVCFPLVIGYFKSASPKFHSGDILSWDIDFEELIGEDQPNLNNVPVLPSFFPIPFEATEYKKTHNISREIGSFPGTAQTIYSGFPYDKKAPKSAEVPLVMNSTDLGTFFDFVCAAKGRFKSFYIYEPVNSFRMYEPIYSGSTQIKVQNNMYAEAFARLPEKAVIVKYRGQSVALTITGVSTNSSFTTLTFNAPINFQIFVEDMDTVRIERRMKVRLDLDEFEIDCQSGNVFKTTVRFMEVL